MNYFDLIVHVSTEYIPYTTVHVVLICRVFLVFHTVWCHSLVFETHKPTFDKWGFLKSGYPWLSFISRWDFPWNKPTNPPWKSPNWCGKPNDKPCNFHRPHLLGMFQGLKLGQVGPVHASCGAQRADATEVNRRCLRRCFFLWEMPGISGNHMKSATNSILFLSRLLLGAVSCGTTNPLWKIL